MKHSGLDGLQQSMVWTEDCCGPRPCGANRLHTVADERHLIAEAGLSLSIGRYYDGMGNSEWITGASVGIGYDIGVGVSYTHYQPGTSVRDNLGADITGNLGIWYASGNYGILSRSWSIGPSYGLPASASMQFGYTK